MFKNPAAFGVALVTSLLCLPFAAMSGPATPTSGSGKLPSVASPRAYFSGVITLEVDLTDTRRRIVTVRQRIPVQSAGEMTLLYPQWEPASHAPSISAHRLAGLIIKAGGKRLTWKRDPSRVHAFGVTVPPGSRELELSFQYLAPLGRDPSATIVDGFVGLYWNRVLLYPSGWKTRDLPVQATVRLPDGMTPATALPFSRDSTGTRFQQVALDRLLDSPVFASRHVVTRNIAAGERPVRAHWLAAEAGRVSQVEQFDTLLRNVQREAEAIFGTPPYKSYDYLIALDDRLPGPGGIEHADSGEVVLPANLMSDLAAASPVIDVIPHELIHAWNGLWRVPADMAVSTPNEPFTGTLLWVYEGQTEFWSRVVAARSGLRSIEQTLGAIALDAAVVQSRPGRQWKSLADSTNDPLIQNGAVYWRDWQGRADYYVEGVLLWLDIEARLRRCSNGQRGLDDFALRFFSAANRKPSERQRPYSAIDIVSVLGQVCTAPWAEVLRKKLEAHEDEGVLDGLASHGWRLVFRDTPTEFYRLYEESEGLADLTWSVGMTLTSSGHVKAVAWDGVAFRAGIVPGARLKKINDEPFSVDRLKITLASRAEARIGVQIDGREEAVTLTAPYGLLYPALERLEGSPDFLSSLLAPRAKPPVAN